MMGAPVLAVMLAAPARATTPFVEQLRRAQARSASDPERVEFATRALREWLPADGRTLLAAAHFARAEGEIALFDDAAAEEDLTKTLEMDPRNLRAKLLRARSRAELGRGAEAEHDALEYLEESADDADGWLALGAARLAMGLPKADRGARAAFAKAAARLDPEDPRPSLGEGRAFLAARRYQESLAALSAAAERPQQRRAEILTWRSRAYSALGDWGASKTDLNRAIPDMERSLEERNRAGVAKRGLDVARGTLADAFFRRGLANEALKERDAALADHRQACNLGLPPACARVDALEKPEPKAPPAPPKPPKAKRKKNPKGDSGERIYAN